MDNTKDVDRAMRAIQAEDALRCEPACWFRRDRPPLGIRSPPLSVQRCERALRAGSIRIGILDPEIDIVGEDRRVTNEEMHSPNHQIIDLMLIERAQNVIDVHGRIYTTVLPNAHTRAGGKQCDELHFFVRPIRPST